MLALPLFAILENVKKNDGVVNFENWTEKLTLTLSVEKKTREQILEKLNTLLPVKIRKINFEIREEEFFTSYKGNEFYFKNYEECIKFVNEIITEEKNAGKEI